MDQQLINAMAAVIGFGAAWWINNIWSMVKVLQQDISNLHIELAKNYVPRQELEMRLTRIQDTLDEIRDEMRKA